MKKIYLSIVLVLVSLISFGQYYYNTPAITPNGNPGGLNNDVERPYGNGLPGGWTVIQPTTHPAWSAPVTLPFTFNFNGQNYTSIRASTTGLVTFTANPATPTGTHNIIPSSYVPDNTICVWGLGYSGSNKNDKMLVKTFGTSPNRQFWIFWDSYNNESLGSKCYTYWSVVLEETSNKIYVVDQMSSTKSSCDPLLTIGLQFNSSSAIYIPGSPNIHPLASNSSSTYDNRYYEFIPGSRPVYDLSVDYIQTNHYQTSSTPVEIRGFIKNFGQQPVTSYDINYTLDNGPVQTEHVSGSNIPLWGTEWYFHDSIWMASGLGVHHLKVWADNINGHSDQNPWNDTLTKEIEVMGVFVPRLAMHEYFNSSNNASCKGAMDTLRKVFTNHPAAYTLIGYQLYTDPYATGEGAARASFYGVDSLPDMFINGINNIDPRFYNELYYNDYQAPAYISITPTLTRSGNTVTATAAILPFPDWTNPPNPMKIRFAIVEKSTTGNVGSNGESKFYSVLRKFLPDVNGITQNSFTSGLYVNVSKSYTFNTGDVEDMDNLGVVVFIQDDVSGEVFQSAFAQINTGIEEGASTQGIVGIYPNPAGDVVQLSYYTPRPSTASLSLYDVSGKILYNRKIQAKQAGLNLHYLDASFLADGIYILHLNIEGHASVKKLIISR